MSSKVMKIGVATALAAGALVVTGTPASAIPRGVHSWRTIYGGTKGTNKIFASGTYRPAKTRDGDWYVDFRVKIKDRKRDGKRAGIEVRFWDHDGNWHSEYLYARRDATNYVAVGSVGSRIGYYHQLDIRKCTFRKTKAKPINCGAFRTYYKGTRVYG